MLGNTKKIKNAPKMLPNVKCDKKNFGQNFFFPLYFLVELKNHKAPKTVLFYKDAIELTSR